jgi:hypothetical protein
MCSSVGSLDCDIISILGKISGISHYTKISSFSGVSFVFTFHCHIDLLDPMTSTWGGSCSDYKDFWRAMRASQSWPQKFMPWMDWLEPVEVSNQLIWLYLNLALQRDSCLQPGVEVHCLQLCNCKHCWQSDCDQWCGARPRMFL